MDEETETPQTHPPTEEELNALFDFIDANDDGMICATEMRKFLQLRGNNPTGEEIQSFLASKDVDADGNYSREEFTALATELLANLPDPEAQLDEALAEIDTDDSGSIQKEELKEYLMNRGDEPISEEEFEELMVACGVTDDAPVIPRAVLKGLFLPTADEHQ